MRKLDVELTDDKAKKQKRMNVGLLDQKHKHKETAVETGFGCGLTNDWRPKPRRRFMGSQYKRGLYRKSLTCGSLLKFML